MHLIIYLFLLCTQDVSADMCRPMLFDEGMLCCHCPRATGIPPHVSILNQLATLNENIQKNSEMVLETLRAELTSRGVGSDTFHANDVLESVKKIHDQMTAMLSNQAAAVLRGGVEGTIAASTGHAPDATVPLMVSQPSGGRRQMYCWGGMLHNVPENFVLPRMSLQTLIVYWYVGSNQPHCPPLKYVKCYDFPAKKKTMKVVLSQMKRMITEVIRASQLVGFYIDERGIDSVHKATKLYEAIGHFFAYGAIKHKRRHSSIAWKTYYSLMQKNKYKFVGEA